MRKRPRAARAAGRGDRESAVRGSGEGAEVSDTRVHRHSWLRANRRVTSSIEFRSSGYEYRAAIPQRRPLQIEAGRGDAAARALDRRVLDFENRVARDVTVAWLDVNNASERIGLTKQFVDQAVQALELAQARYDLGLNPSWS